MLPAFLAMSKLCTTSGDRPVDMLFNRPAKERTTKIWDGERFVVPELRNDAVPAGANYYEVILTGGKCIRCVGSVIFILHDQSLRPVEQLALGSILRAWKTPIGGFETAVVESIKVETLSEHTYAYTIVVPDSHRVMVNGIVVADSSVEVEVV